MKKNFISTHFQDLKQPTKDWLYTAAFLLLATCLAIFLYLFVSQNPTTISLFYMVGIVTITRYTHGYQYGIFASFFGVIFINCFFTYPYFQIDFSQPDYAFTFLCTLSLSLVTSATTTHLRQQAEFLRLHERQLAEAEKEKMRANLLRSVSHDLRTPLTSILGRIAVMKEGRIPYTAEEYRQEIANIEDDASWLLNMVENILSVTRIQTGSSKLNTVPELAEEVISEAVVRLKKRIPSAGIQVEIPSEILMVPMDAMLIEQVLINLMENAILHSKSEDAIKLILENHTGHILFRIIDHGAGLNDYQLEHIFDGSYAKSPSSDAKRGMGIGLSICQTIVIAHGGTISAKNHGTGAEFQFTLPKEESYA
ncbi:DUF4118 domain-containing protein [Lachnospiraceae bacterium 29-84]